MSSDLLELRGRDPHTVLGVDEGASKQEVAQAFRTAARDGHPDTGGDEQTFRQLTRARDILMDSRRFADYTAAQHANGFSQARSYGRHYGAASTTFTHRDAQSAGPQSPASAATSQAARRVQSPPPASGKIHPFFVVALFLIFTGPLLLPVAALVGLLAVWRIGKKSG